MEQRVDQLIQELVEKIELADRKDHEIIIAFYDTLNHIAGHIEQAKSIDARIFLAEWVRALARGLRDDSEKEK